jgi:hypothetical protein
VRFCTEVALDARAPISESRFGDLAEALRALDAGDPEIADVDLDGSLADGCATVTMTVEADDPADAATKALCVARTALHAIGEATPGWERAPSVLRAWPGAQADEPADQGQGSSAPAGS